MVIHRLCGTSRRRVKGSSCVAILSRGRAVASPVPGLSPLSPLVSLGVPSLFGVPDFFGVVSNTLGIQHMILGSSRKELFLLIRGYSVP